MRKIFVSSILFGSGTFIYQYEYRYKPNQFRKEEVINDMRQVPWKFRILTLLPLNISSRMWGKVNRVTLPEYLRTPLISIYIRRYNCDMSEVMDPELTHYSNLGDFFRRKLKTELRPIDQTHHLVSPCDGKILSAGRIQSNEIQQVKGMTYNIDYFFGSNQVLNNSIGNNSNPHLDKDKTTNSDSYNVTTKLRQSHHQGSSTNNSKSNTGDNMLSETLSIDGNNTIDKYLENKNNCLYQCVIYLSPGDYHRFHSPADWTCSIRRYFPGYLMSVSPEKASSIPQLFNLNERVGYFGKWMNGYFTMTAIGATNVGSIRVYNDLKLTTNKKMIQKENFIEENFPDNLKFLKGEQFGEFNFGSTIVLIFEASKEFKFLKKVGEKVNYGEALGR